MDPETEAKEARRDCKPRGTRDGGRLDAWGGSVVDIITDVSDAKSVKVESNSVMDLETDVDFLWLKPKQCLRTRIFGVKQCRQNGV